MIRKVWQNHPAWCIFALTLLVFLFGQFSREVLMIDTRFGLFVYEMAENGIGPYPQLYGQWYPDYNSFSTFLSYLAGLLFGVNQFSLTLPSALAGAAMEALFFIFCDRRFSRNFAVAAVCFSLASLEYLNICRISSLDLYPALAAWAGFMLAMEEEGKARRLFWVPLLYIFAYLARGPIGVITVAVPVVAGCFAHRTKKMILNGLLCGFAAAGVMALGGAVWLTLADRCGGKALVKLVLNMQIGSRLGKGKPIWYYFTNAAGSYAPLFIAGYAMLLWALLRLKKRLWQKPEDETVRIMQGMLLWVVIFLGGMSLPGTKHLRYIVSLVPVMAFFAAQVAVPLKPECEFPSVVTKWLGKVLALLPGIGAAALTVLLIVLPYAARNAPLRWWPPAAGIVILLWTGRKSRNPWFKLAVFCIILQLGIIEPVTEATQSSVRFVQAAEKNRPKGGAITFFALGPDGDENKYMFHVARERIFVPRYAGSVKQLNALPPNTLVVTRRDHWEKLVPASERQHYRKLLSGQLGHRKALLLRKTSIPGSLPQ